MRVLIVDDHHDTAEMLSMLLGAAGHDVRASYRGDEAITMAATFEPELALVDIQLTDTTGFAVARQLRKQFGKRIHLVAITGGDDRNLPFAGIFNEHARKPVTAARLYQTLDTARDALRGG
jgi:CheY-like chemotaxis protein